MKKSSTKTVNIVIPLTGEIQTLLQELSENKFPQKLSPWDHNYAYSINSYTRKKELLCLLGKMIYEQVKNI